MLINKSVGLNRGFTLIEIMVVVVIIGILASVVGPMIGGKSNAAKQNAVSQQMRSFEVALGAFEIKASRYPTTEEGLKSLVRRPGDCREAEWDGPYMKEIPRDPYGEEYIYRCPGENNKGYELVCKGLDRQENTADDITNVARDSE